MQSFPKAGLCFSAAEAAEPVPVLSLVGARARSHTLQVPRECLGLCGDYCTQLSEIMELCLFSTRSCFTLTERPELKEMAAEAQGLLSRLCPAVGGAREELLLCSPYGQLL